jgi:predicted AAA+ superfamily ATPase
MVVSGLVVGYRQRVVDAELDELMGGLAAVALEGPKAVGKTATASMRARSVYRLDDPAVVEIARADPSRLVRGDRPVLIDEWQRLPTSWDIVRRAVDADGAAGQFLLTGSAVPLDASTHSGAGRIASVRMRPLSLAERDVATPTVSLGVLLAGTRPALTGATGMSVAEYTAEIVGSGFPAIRPLSGRVGRAQLDGYLRRVVERDFDELGSRVRNPAVLRRWMTAYAAASSTTASFEVIRDAASPGETDKPAKSTTIPYRRALEALWIIEEVPAWLPTANHLRRLGESPRHQLCDPALAARLLGVDAGALLDAATPGPVLPRDGTLLGALFESLVTLSVRVYAQANEAAVSHLRTRGGEHEVDLIVERGDGRVVAIEVKLARSVEDRDVGHLRWLGDRIGPDLLDAVVVTTGPEAYRRSDGIGVVPAALLTV